MSSSMVVFQFKPSSSRTLYFYILMLKAFFRGCFDRTKASKASIGQDFRRVGVDSFQKKNR
jgi:hypothetical protein